MGSEAVEILKLKRYIHCFFTGREKYGLKNKERRKRMESLKIFCAGVAGKLADEAVRRLETMYPDIKVELIRGGSTAGVNRLLSGDIFDVMILADNSNIDQMLMPSYVDGYFIWGGNEMVIMGNDITDENWKEKLLDPRAVITHRNPYDDPGGYRAVMALKLSEKIEKGLSERIFSNPGYKGLDRAQYVRKVPPPFWGGKPPEKRDSPKGLPPMNAGHYDIIYKSAPVGMGRNFATLPGVMNLGNPVFEKDYNSVSFEVDGGEIVRGTTIFHAICIPINSENKADANKFVKEFLKTDFVQKGFTDVQRSVGKWDFNFKT